MVDIIILNCCQPRSSQKVQECLSHILQSTPLYTLLLDTAILLGLLEKDFKKVVTCKLHKLLSHIMETHISLPNTASSLYPIVGELEDVGLLMIIGRRSNKLEDHTLLLNVPKLTNEVHKLLFSDSKHVTHQLSSYQAPLSASMGILPQSYLRNILPEYISIDCLIQLQYCQEFDHAVVKSDYSVTPTESSNASTLLYFPALCKIERRNNIETPVSYKYHIGWFAECVGKFDYFPPRFLHVLLLRLAFKYAQPVAPCETEGQSEVELEMLKSNCRCTMWKNGIHWHMEEGVECIVELVSNSKGLVIITKSEEEYINKCKCTDMLFRMIGMSMQAKAEFCPSVSLKQYLMLLNCNDISSFSDRDRLFDMSDVDRVLKEGKDSILSITGKWPVKANKLAHLKKFTFWGKKYSYVFSLCS